MPDNIKSKSRRRTPWTSAEEAAPLQTFIDKCTERDYNHRHPRLDEMGESAFLNSYEVTQCKYCGSPLIRKEGYSDKEIRRYRCKECGKRFNILTNTIFDSHRLSISEWMGFLLDIFGFGSFNLTSKVNRNANNTTKYWISKVFLLLDGIQDDMVLEGDVWLDETFIRVRNPDIQVKDDGTEYRGLSRNQLCIGVACDSSLHCLFFVEGNGKASGKRTIEAFGRHIKPGSRLIHDLDGSHHKLVTMLDLESEAYDSREIKKFPDSKNPLNPVNQLCRLLQMFLRSHAGFIREDLQGYLNMFFVIMNPPENKYEKIEKILELGFQKSVLLRYREQKR
jgi:transposase-like protein